MIISGCNLYFSFFFFLKGEEQKNSLGEWARNLKEKKKTKEHILLILQI